MTEDKITNLKRDNNVLYRFVFGEYKRKSRTVEILCISVDINISLSFMIDFITFVCVLLENFTKQVIECD